MKTSPYKQLLAGASALALATLMAVPSLAQTTRRAAPDSRPAPPAAAPVGGVVQAAEPLGTISFKAAHETHANEGHFKKWRFTEINKPADGIVGGSATIEIDITSISAKQQVETEENPRLTNHLKANDFFDAEKFPKAILKISDIKKAEAAEGEEAPENAYTAMGQLTVREVSAPISFDFTVVQETPLKIAGTAKVNRDTHTIGAPFEEGNPRSIQQLVDVEFETLVPDTILPPVDELVEEAKEAMPAPPQRPQRPTSRRAN